MLIKEGDWVIIDENGDKRTFIKLQAKNQTVKVGQRSVSTSPIIGLHFGSTFQVTADGKGITLLDRPVMSDVTRVTDTERDNSSLLDLNTENQKLEREDIETMKSSGKSGDEIISALISNSATFDAKTEFSQDKYKRKKTKKYISTVTVRRPTGFTICESYFKKEPERVFNLRSDTLAIALSYANIAAGAKVLVIDGCMGVVLASVVERLGGYGHVCCAHVAADRSMPYDAARHLNLSPLHLAAMSACSLEKLEEIKAQPPPAAAAGGAAADTTTAGGDTPMVVADSEKPASATPVAAADTITADSDTPMAAADSEKPAAGTDDAAAGITVTAADTNIAGGDSPVATADNTDAAADTTMVAADSKKPARDKATDSDKVAEAKANQLSKGNGVFGSRASPDVLASLVHPGFSCCIIAAPKLHAASLMARVLPLLRPSAFFVVFSNTAQNLAECMNGLQSTRQALNMQLQESWLRPYQVLPMRTHPMMSCEGTGGYLLSGIKTTATDQFGGAPGGHHKRLKQQQEDGKQRAQGGNKRMRT